MNSHPKHDLMMKRDKIQWKFLPVSIAISVSISSVVISASLSFPVPAVSIPISSISGPLSFPASTFLCATSAA